MHLSVFFSPTDLTNAFHVLCGFFLGILRIVFLFYLSQTKDTYFPRRHAHYWKLTCTQYISVHVSGVSISMYVHSQSVTYTESSAELHRVITGTLHFNSIAALPFLHIPTYFHRHPSGFKCFVYNKKRMTSSLVHLLPRSIIINEASWFCPDFAEGSCVYYNESGFAQCKWDDVLYMTVNAYCTEKAMTVKNLLLGSKHKSNRRTYSRGR